MSESKTYYSETVQNCPECERLRRVLAQELSENDDIGAEYSYVMALKEALRERNLRIEELETTVNAIANDYGTFGYIRQRSLNLLVAVCKTVVLENKGDVK